MSCEMNGHKKIIFLEDFSNKPFDELGKEVRDIADMIWDVLVETTDYCRFKQNLSIFRKRNRAEGAKCKADMVYETKMKSHKAWVIEFNYSGTWSSALFEIGLCQTLNGQKIDLDDDTYDSEDAFVKLCRKYHCIADRICSSEASLGTKKREIVGIDGSQWLEIEQDFIDPTLKTTVERTHPDIETNPALEDIIEEHYDEAKVWHDLTCVVQSASCTHRDWLKQEKEIMLTNKFECVMMSAELDYNDIVQADLAVPHLPLWKITNDQLKENLSDKIDRSEILHTDVNILIFGFMQNFCMESTCKVISFQQHYRAAYRFSFIPEPHANHRCIGSHLRDEVYFFLRPLDVEDFDVENCGKIPVITPGMHDNEVIEISKDLNIAYKATEKLEDGKFNITYFFPQNDKEVQFVYDNEEDAMSLDDYINQEKIKYMTQLKCCSLHDIMAT